MKGDKCSIKDCDKLAIGYESHIGFGINVCEIHCSKEVLDLEPGESNRDPPDNYYRYEED